MAAVYPTIELHLLQSFAPSCLNRDDTNTPKDCMFGGVRRARISSQCFKRAIRRSDVFQSVVNGNVGQRTKLVAKLLRDRLVAAGKDPEQAAQVTTDFILAYAGGLDSDGERTKVLLYLGDAEVQRWAEALLGQWDALTGEGGKAAGAEARPGRRKASAGAGDLIKALVRDLLKTSKTEAQAPDIALFGRMLAENPDANIDAACQVAHAISTHRVEVEMDFYTAVDDLQPKEDTGAGMMGFTGYDSACFYRYARIDGRQLLENLKSAELAEAAAGAFLRASAIAVPSARQNAFAAFNPPSFALAVVRRDGQGWNLANAFERPVPTGGDSGLVERSVSALDAYWGRLSAAYGASGVAAAPFYTLESDHKPANLTERVSGLDELVDKSLAAWRTVEG